MSATDRTLTLPIFPLHTVLFPGGLLPLRIFEQRYLDMTKACLRDGTPFGVCLIQEGTEVGTPAMPTDVGCEASIVEWEMPQLGIFHLVARGERRFRLLSTRTESSGLLLGDVLPLDPEPAVAVSERHARCVGVLQQLAERVPEARVPTPHRFDDATWVSYRLAEALPIDRFEKQRMLVTNDAEARLDRILHLLKRG